MISRDSQQKNFIFALRSFAREFGMKPQDWQFKMVTWLEKKRMEKFYYPTLWVLPAKGTVTDFYIDIKSGLTTPPAVSEAADIRGQVAEINADYLIAYNENKRR